MVSMTWLRVGVGAVEHLLVRLRRRLPYLVWVGDELDVQVRFRGIGAVGGRHDDVTIFGIQQDLANLGIEFDTGSGREGRDWEWDASLAGPVSVRFRGRARHPERRWKKRPWRASW